MFVENIVLVEKTRGWVIHKLNMMRASRVEIKSNKTQYTQCHFSMDDYSNSQFTMLESWIQRTSFQMSVSSNMACFFTNEDIDHNVKHSAGGSDGGRPKILRNCAIKVCRHWQLRHYIITIIWLKC